ncbi:hypothetical protein ABZP36_005115 [Zizania latifolia]
MATPWSVALTILFFCIFLLETICSSGASLDCSYGSAQVKILSSSVVTEQQNVYLFLKPFRRSTRPCTAKQLAGSFVHGVVVPNLHLNVSGIVVRADERQLGALHCNLESIHASLAAAGLEKSVKVSPELSLLSLRVMAKNRRRDKKDWRRVIEFVRRSASFVLVEMETEEKGELAVAAVIQEAAADVAAVLDGDVGVVFRLKSRAAPSAAEMARLIGDAGWGKRLMGVLTDVSSPRRELAAARTTAHDVFAPVTNPTTMPVTNPTTMPVTNPVTVPATNPATNPVYPGIVTVPSTNPGTGYATNPNLPPLYPEPTPTPVTMPDPTTMPSPMTTPTPFMNPVTTPTMPSPVTNPTSPVTNPTTTPVTSPGTTYPYPQQGGAGVTPTMPGTVQPAAPTVSGQTWCVAKTGLMDAVLQNGLDYACGIGGADCSAIQPMGACYNPNTLQAHASYAFNSYFQRNPSPASCDFGGAGMLVSMNPSSGTCMYQTSASYGAVYSPGVTGTGTVGGATPLGPAVGGGSGSTVLNSNNPGGDSMYGSDNPTSLTGGAASLSCSWVLCLVWILTFAYVKEKV